MDNENRSEEREEKKPVSSEHVNLKVRPRSPSVFVCVYVKIDANIGRRRST